MFVVKIIQIDFKRRDNLNRDILLLIVITKNDDQYYKRNRKH